MVGIDIVDVKRIKQLNKNGQLEKKILSGQELNYLNTKSMIVVKGRQLAERDYSLAGFWAAKEAVLKAFGVGINNINFKQIEILHKKSGAPYVNIEPEMQKKLCEKMYKNAEISISHDGELAISICVLN